MAIQSGATHFPTDGLAAFRSCVQGKRSELRRKARESLKWQGIERFAVLYMKDGREHRSPWFSSRTRAQTALALMQSKHGAAMVYVD